MVRTARRLTRSWGSIGFKATPLACGAVVAFALAFTGCGKPTAAPEDPTEKNLRLAVMAYQQFVNKNQQAPRSAGDLAPFLQDMGAKPDTTLRSGRDHEPFVILWNVDEFPAIILKKAEKEKKDKKEKDKEKSLATRVKHCVLAYEKSGSDGYRYVGFSNGYVAEMSEEDLAKAAFPANHKFGSAR
jgi:hypothetical protein